MSTTVCISFYQIVVCIAKQKFNLVHGAFLRSSERILIWCSCGTKGVSAERVDSFRLNFVSVSDELVSKINDYL